MSVGDNSGGWQDMFGLTVWEVVLAALLAFVIGSFLQGALPEVFKMLRSVFDQLVREPWRHGALTEERGLLFFGQLLMVGHALVIGGVVVGWNWGGWIGMLEGLAGGVLLRWLIERLARRRMQRGSEAGGWGEPV